MQLDSVTVQWSSVLLGTGARSDRYKKKDAGGPTALIKKLTNDLKMEMQANDMEEKTAQEDYEELMADSAEKRAGDSKTITEKEAQKVGCFTESSTVMGSKWNGI